MNRRACPGYVSLPLSRREMLQRSAGGFGMLALSALLAEYGHAQEPRPHFAPRAKNVIFLFMDGGVSHVDSFDPKERLQRESGKQLPLERPKHVEVAWVGMDELDRLMENRAPEQTLLRDIVARGLQVAGS